MGVYPNRFTFSGQAICVGWTPPHLCYECVIKYQALSAGNAYGLWHQHQERECILNQDPDEANDEKYNNHKYTAVLPFDKCWFANMVKDDYQYADDQQQ